LDRQEHLGKEDESCAMKIRELEEMLSVLPSVADQTVARINSSGKNIMSSEINTHLCNEVEGLF
jgi:hypothetical protein